jgi:hypothetical protein
MSSNNIDILTKEYVDVVHEMTTCMKKMEELKLRATNLEKQIESLNKDSSPKEIIQPLQKQTPKEVVDSDSDSVPSDSDDSVEIIENLSDDDAESSKKVKSDVKTTSAPVSRGRGRGRGRGGSRGGRGGKNGNNV